MPARPWTLLTLASALAGFAFATVSTSDFAAHLDRQVHGVHCSFLPGLGPADVSGTTGCHATLMSRYSSVMRDSVWGGVPISLAAMSVFAYLAFWCGFLLLRKRERDPRAALYLVTATLLPVASSVVMGYLAFTELQAACKLCIGIYASSGVAFVGALGLFVAGRSQRRTAVPEWAADAGTAEAGAEPVAAPSQPPLGWGALALAFLLGVAFVLVPVAAYAKEAPDFSRYIGKCGELRALNEAGNVLVPFGPQGRASEMVEVLDPLCPACKAFEGRYAMMPLAAQVSRKALLFPLDDTCNWMVDSAIHPGACAVSEAVLCAKGDAGKVLAWAFAEQEAITSAARKDPEAAARMVKARFPEVGECVGSAPVRARLNVALRFAVKNKLQVLTPQIYVAGRRLCDEDTDLGLDYALPRLIASGTGKGGGR